MRFKNENNNDVFHSTQSLGRGSVCRERVWWVTVSFQAVEPAAPSGAGELPVSSVSVKETDVYGMTGQVNSSLLLLAETLSKTGNWAALICSFPTVGFVPPEFNVPLFPGNAPTGRRHVPRLPWIGLNFYSAFYSHSLSLKWVMNFISYSKTTPGLGKGTHQYLLLCSRVGVAPQG